ncbi:polysaccharide biosynthesis tyrosine autokinase [Psychromonas sp. RZ22]|uniref:polysaccharide biosynthesis tyrosine autokinase n=1 Tax=Psychromonas algarum TaxID=2555643 RepID=UPI001068A5F3|nr:polysaccharide biosynthesis tyrosine autokinase [Psychromonas sp. RZ22]TEW55757.1 polysaccharide biosynthesis tyrosine autokinase [Psychromonas sp. RZ22]
MINATNQNSNRPHQEQQKNADVIDLGKLLGLLLDSKWLIVCVTTIFAVIGIAYALLATPIYKADALLQVETKNTGMSALVGDMGDMFSAESSATTEVEIIKSRMILGQTVDQLNLTIQATPIYWPVIGKGLARLQNESASIVITRFQAPESNVDQSFILQVDDNQLGSFSIIDEDDNKIVSGLVGEALDKNGYSLFVQHLDAPNGSKFNISKRSKLDAIQWLQENLSVSERGKQTGILSLSFSGENKAQIEKILNDISQYYFLQNVKRDSAEAEQSLAFLNKHLPSIKSELTTAEDTLNAYRQKNESVDLGLEAKSTLETMVELESQLNELTFKESEISQRFTKDHPAYKSLLDKRKVLLGEKKRLNAQITKLPKTQRAVLRMTRDVEVNQQIYIQLLNKVQELSILKAGTVGNVRILDKAQSYTNAVKPKKPLIVVLATLLGGMLSVAFVLLKAAFHRGVENPTEIEALGLPVYASIPKSDWQEKLDAKFKRKKHPNSIANILAEANPADLSVEALRGLRTSLHFAMMEAKNNVVMISGPAPGIGKSFVSINFAAVIAKTGQKVLLIDADMRKGHLNKRFGLEAEKGLSDILSGQLAFAEVTKDSKIENLDVVTRGKTPPNPSELLMHGRFAEFIDWASKEYDLILIDTPPVLAVTDPSIVGALAGTSLMVGRFDQTTVKEVEVALHRFDMAGIEIKGFILNAVEKKASSSYGYGYYNYSYKSDKAE